MSFLRPDLRCLAPVDSDDSDDGPLFRVGRFVEPVHLVGLASAAHGIARRGATSRIEVHDEAATYAARMRLGPALAHADCRHQLPMVREHPQRGRLLEVSAIHGADDVRALAGQVRERVRRRSLIAAHGLYDAITEMGINVDEHAHPAGAAPAVKGFVAAQTMHKTREWVFAVADFGVGMHRTLRDRGARDDRHAISMAVEGTSRHALQVTRGLGIRETVHHSVSLGGSFYLATGTAGFAAADRVRSLHGLTHRYDGTILQVRIPLP